jgi:hypothetical protein
MSKVRLTGATSGYTEITAPAVAGNTGVDGSLSVSAEF